MANIVVATYNPLKKEGGIFPYVETFLAGLKYFGNNILHFEKKAVEKIIDNKIPKKYLDRIQNFNPDLFILFDNQFWDISSLFDVPIIIYDIDSPVAYANIDRLNNNDRYKFLCITKEGKSVISDVIGCSDKNICYIPPFTGVVAREEKIERNIGFCGSHWLWNNFNEVFDFIKENPSNNDREIAKKVWKEYQNNPFFFPEDFYIKNKYIAEKHLKTDNLYNFSTRISGLKRARYLLAIEDLGLEIRGLHWNNPNCQILKAFPELLLSYSAEKIINTNTTEKFYNSSKIGFCVNHIQANSGFSWRVCDILASNACLVAERTKDLLSFGFNVPTFDSIAGAREECIKILTEENMRFDIVEATHEIIDKNHRFKNILPIIENFIGINLHSNGRGTIETVFTDYFNARQFNLKRRIYNRLTRYLYKLLIE